MFGVVKRLESQTHCFYHNIIHSKNPSYLYDKISSNKDLHSLNTHSRSNISLPSHRTTFSERSFKYDVYSLYNPIPINLELLNKHRFKKSIKMGTSSKHSGKFKFCQY